MNLPLSFMLPLSFAHSTTMAIWAVTFHYFSIDCSPNDNHKKSKSLNQSLALLCQTSPGLLPAINIKSKLSSMVYHILYNLVPACYSELVSFQDYLGLFYLSICLCIYCLSPVNLTDLVTPNLNSKKNSSHTVGTN